MLAEGTIGFYEQVFFTEVVKPFFFQVEVDAGSFPFDQVEVKRVSGLQ